MKINSNIKYIILFGLVLRILFILFGTHHYFDMRFVFYSGDTGAWLAAFINLIEEGSFSVNLDREYGYFGRMPGYSFIIGPIYYLFGKNAYLSYYFIEFTQLLLDSLNIYIIYLLSKKIFKIEFVALISSILYAIYPFVIVWVAAIHSEIYSIFFMLMGLIFFIDSQNFKDYFRSGLLLGIGVLLRPQLLFLLPLLVLLIFLFNRNNLKNSLKFSVFFGMGILLTYGLWPLRNYLLHDKIVLVQDTRGFRHWDEDVVSFMNFIYSVKTDWQPQFYQILENKSFDMPPIIASSKEDSAMLVKAVYLAKNCGSGFSYWSKYYWKKPVTDNNCNEEIALLFNTLRERQIEKNPLNYYLNVPLGNLEKAIFKLSLTDSSTVVRKLVSVLFILRTIAIILGLGSIFFIIFKSNLNTETRLWNYVFLFFFLFVYLILCFGTGTQMRNIEMRYFIHADIILLIPLSYTIYMVFKKKLNLD